MLKVEIFDPPLCCPTGICGPTIDPALLDAQEALLRVQSEFDGRVRVERYALGQQPGKFMQQPEVVARLKAQGVTVLPITVVGGRAVKEKGVTGVLHCFTGTADLARKALDTLFGADSHTTISALVHAKDAETAVRALHDGFGLGE